MVLLPELPGQTPPPPHQPEPCPTFALLGARSVSCLHFSVPSGFLSAPALPGQAQPSPQRHLTVSPSLHCLPMSPSLSVLTSAVSRAPSPETGCLPTCPVKSKNKVVAAAVPLPEARGPCQFRALISMCPRWDKKLTDPGAPGRIRKQLMNPCPSHVT